MKRFLWCALISLASVANGVQLSGVYQGIALTRPGDYSYAPTSMIDNGSTKCWFCTAGHSGGYDDTIYYTENFFTPQLVLCSSDNELCTDDYPTGQDQIDTCDPTVVKVNGTYYMYYTSLILGGPYGSTNDLFLAMSQDGIHWTKYPANQPPAPIMEPFFGTAYGIGGASVVYDGSQFRMWFTFDKWWTDGNVWYATSTDGIHFQVINKIYPGPTTPNWGGAVDVKYISGWGLWFMVSNPIAGDPDAQVLWNISRDGIHWLPYNESRRIPRGAGQPHNPGIVGDSRGFVGDGTLGPQTFDVVFGDGNPFDHASSLGRSTVTLTPEPLYGYFDQITADYHAVGWAYDPDTGANDAAVNGDPSAPLGFSTYVSVWVDGVPQHNWQPSEVSRCDVRDAGLAPDCYHGFDIDLRGVVPSGTHTVQIEGGEFPTGSGGRMLNGTFTVTMP
jgi:hypothetical protein